MIKQMLILTCLIVFLGGNTHSVFAQQAFAFPRLCFSAIVIPTEEELGPFYSATPVTLSQREFYIGARYIFLDYKIFWGLDLDEPANRLNPLAGGYSGFIRNHIIRLSVAYGITDNLLLGAVIPWNSVSARSAWAGSEFVPPGSIEDQNQGIGDIVVSAQYKIFEETDGIPFSWAIGADIKLTTGNSRLLEIGGQSVGTGEKDYRILTMISKNFTRVATYLNLGYNWEGRDKVLDTLEYNLALVLPISKNLAISGEFLGVSFVNWNTGTDFGGIVDTNTMNTYDAGLGVKFRTKGIIFELGFAVPLNGDYLRTKFQPTIGINYAF